jgi:predicted transcriptional regulator
MKTVISVPDDVFARAEALARRSGRSRSQIYSAALREYVARHAPDDVTEALDRVAQDLGKDDAEVAFPGAAMHRVLETTEW